MWRHSKHVKDEGGQVRLPSKSNHFAQMQNPYVSSASTQLNMLMAASCCGDTFLQME